MARAWGREGTRAWIDAPPASTAMPPSAPGAGKDLATELGAIGVSAWSEGRQPGGGKSFGNFNFRINARGINVNVPRNPARADRTIRVQQDLRETESSSCRRPAPAPHRPGDLSAIRNDAQMRNQPFRQLSSGVNTWPIEQPVN